MLVAPGRTPLNRKTASSGKSRNGGSTTDGGFSEDIVSDMSSLVPFRGPELTVWPLGSSSGTEQACCLVDRNQLVGSRLRH